MPDQILVVEDDSNLAFVLCETLRLRGYRAEAVGTLAALRERLTAAPYDLVLLDLRLPDIDGRVVWEWVNERRPALVRRVAFMTGDTMSEETQHFLEETGRPVVSKPLSIARVREVLDEIAPVS